MPALENVRVRWLYTANEDQHYPDSTWIGLPIAGGPLLSDLARSSLLWAEHETCRLREVIERIGQASGGDASEGCWVVGHNEGILVAQSLCRQRRAVHLSVQDDVPDGIFARSARYRWMSALARPVFYDVLSRVRSFDVTSDGMSRYYRYLVDRRPIVVHPYVPALPDPPEPVRSGQTRDSITVGHIGTLYNLEEWRTFMSALGEHAAAIGRRPRMILIGLAKKFHADVAAYVDPEDIIGDMSEGQAIARLADCDFMYAMYPFDRRSEVFRRTSLPTKLTTYLKCKRPVFAHTPVPSSLSVLVKQFAIGVVCSSADSASVRKSINELMGTSIPAALFERARSEIYGIDNVKRLEAALQSL